MQFLKDMESASPSTHGLSRSKVRSLLKKSGASNACAFTQATACYLEFLSKYCYLLGYTDENERLSQIRATLLKCWRYAPYIRRVSDFERALEIRLQAKSASPFLDFPSPHQKLASLTSMQRFLLVARSFQNWSYKSLHLSTRIKKHELSSALTDLKCALIGFDHDGFKTSQQVLLLRVNDLLEGELNGNEYRTIESELAGQSQIRDFKARWLSYRCELAELKQQMTLSESTIDAFKVQLTEDLRTIPIKQPKLSDTLINQFSFSRMPEV